MRGMLEILVAILLLEKRSRISLLYYLFNLTFYPENYMTLQALELRSFLNKDNDDDDDDDDPTPSR